MIGRGPRAMFGMIRKFWIELLYGAGFGNIIVMVVYFFSVGYLQIHLPW